MIVKQFVERTRIGGDEMDITYTKKRVVHFIKEYWNRKSHISF